MRKKANIEADIKRKEDALKINENLVKKLTAEARTINNKIRQIDENTADGAKRIAELNKHAERLIRDLNHHAKEHLKLREELLKLLDELKAWEKNEYRKEMEEKGLEKRRFYEKKFKDSLLT